MSASATENYLDSSTTPRPSLRLVSDAASDQATRAWISQTAEYDALVARAREKIRQLMALPPGWDGRRAAPISRLAGMVMNGLVGNLVSDGIPSPQLTPSPDGGIDVEWLVAGLSVNASVDPMGAVSLAVEDGSKVELETEFPFWQPDFMLIEQARLYLQKMGDQLRGPVDAE